LEYLAAVVLYSVDSREEGWLSIHEKTLQIRIIYFRYYYYYYFAPAKTKYQATVIMNAIVIKKNC
jgi:hypothetical protein